MAQTEETAFPRLTSAELALVRRLPKPCDYADGDVVFRAGQPDIDLYVVESGQMEIRNRTDSRLIAVFEPGNFSGDIDMLTGRPVMGMGVVRGPTRLLCVPNGQLRSLINRVPSLGEKLIIAFTRRRELLSQMGGLGLRVFGPGRCRATSTVREFLYKNFVPFHWLDTETESGKQALAALGSPPAAPVIECGNGRILVNPSLQQLAIEAGVWRHCATQDVDFAIAGAGPAGTTAAGYASSAGVSPLVFRHLGAGGQVRASSRLSNFFRFPPGLAARRLADRVRF